ncbi:MAG: RNA 2'-phosphotransferase, partial [Pseudomonas sp.]|nr:RNA 2'-phosphotransferase [Pseudomonas sp.]
MNQKQRDTLSKFLSYVLRHAPESIDLSLNRDGWADVDALIHGAGRQGHAFDLHALREVVETNDKRRFTLSDDGRRIRAAQGHSSVQVEVRHVGQGRGHQAGVGKGA